MLFIPPIPVHFKTISIKLSESKLKYKMVLGIKSVCLLAFLFSLYVLFYKISNILSFKNNFRSEATLKV